MKYIIKEVIIITQKNVKERRTIVRNFRNDVNTFAERRLINGGSYNGIKRRNVMLLFVSAMLLYVHLCSLAHA